MPPEIARPDLVDSLLAAAREGPPVLLTGPPGAGKTTLLQAAARALAAQGWTCVYLDLMGAASSPEPFVGATLDALPAEAFGARMPEAVEIRRLAASERASAEAAVGRLFSLLSSLDETAARRPVCLLLDEPTEIRSLAYFEGLRGVAEQFGSALARRPRGTLLATSYPTLARSLWAFGSVAARPLTPADLEGRIPPGRAEDVIRGSFGWPRYAQVLLEAADAPEGPQGAWRREMRPGGRLEQACRHTYETLLLRSRGYGMSKTLLAMIAREEGRNLTALYRELRRSPGATRDYLGWLLNVDAVHALGKRYFYRDGLLRQWVRLHSRGRIATAAEIAAAAREVFERPLEPAAAPAPPPPVPSRRDSLIEID